MKRNGQLEVRVDVKQFEVTDIENGIINVGQSWQQNVRKGSNSPTRRTPAHNRHSRYTFEDTQSRQGENLS